MENETDSALRRLLDRLRLEDRLIVAFSGGADSALLAWAAHEVLGSGCVAVTAVSTSLPAAERLAAKQFATQHGIPHVEVCTDELDRPEYQRNDGQRCFHCKSALFDALDPLATIFDASVALGINLDDLGDYRPGQRAVALRGGLAPMVDAQLTKAQVRAVSAAVGLKTSAKPAAACLASRIAFGDTVTTELLGRIERAEETLHRLGFAECRVRAHGNGTVARIEVPSDRLADAMAARTLIDGELRDFGFVYTTLDLAGLRSGSMNALLSLPTTR